MRKHKRGNYNLLVLSRRLKAKVFIVRKSRVVSYLGKRFLNLTSISREIFKEKNKRLFIYGAGGLGNQLFQLAAGYSIRDGREIVFEIGFSGPRKPSIKNHFYSSLSLNDGIKVKSSNKLNAITQILLSYLLRVSTKTSGIESSRIHRIFSSLIGSVYFSFYYKCFLVMTISKGVGSYELQKYKSNQMIVGYFQSYRYLEDEIGDSNFSSLLELRNPGPDLIDWTNLAKKQNPIIIHIRLGDYLYEKQFGVVTTKYMSEALAKLSSKRDSRPIWVFTDQKDLALDIFPSDYRSRAVWVPEIDSDPFSTLLVMRLGSGYVIANSTFGWWAAWSKESANAPVFCPTPWFSGLETPSNLIPKDWIPIPSYFKESK